MALRQFPKTLGNLDFLADRQPLHAPSVLNRTWAFDCRTETFYDRRRIRLLTVIDEGNRAGLEIAMGVSLPSRRVIRVLSELVALHGCPSALCVDHGPECTVQPVVEWCAEHRVTLHDIQPGKPDQNASSERFNRSDRTEVLNALLFESLAELRTLTDAWLRIYNGERPQTSMRQPSWIVSSPGARVLTSHHRFDWLPDRAPG